MWLGQLQALDDALKNRQALAMEKLNLDLDIMERREVKSTGDIRQLLIMMRTIKLSRIENIQQLQKSASAQITMICLLPTMLATIATLVDHMFTSQMIITTISIALIPCTSYMLLTRGRREPHTVAIIYLAQLASCISGSVTSCWFITVASNNIVAPFLCYMQEDISDDTEIRWTMYGLLFDLVYIITLEVFALARRGWLLFILLPCWWFFIATMVAIATYDDRWEPDAASRPQPLLRPTSRLSSVYRWPVQLIIFRLNKLVRTTLIYKRGSTRRQGYVEHLPAQPRPKYQYNDLHNADPASKGTFRVLRILRGDPGQEVFCQLETVPSPETVPFEAISYVWGAPPHPRADINIDYQTLAITKTAYDIITRRRSSYRDRLIWIDQVCINQEDILERQHQVQIMKDIYKGASGVVAYLGPAQDSYLLQAHFAELYWRQEVFGYSPEKLQESYRFGNRATEWDAQLQFFAHPWFRRVWIIQEAVFAKNLMLLYGDVCLDWTMISRVLNVLFENKILGTPQTNNAEVFGRIRDDYQAGLHNLDSILERRGDVRYGKAFDLAHVLEMSARSISTDPRDKIYAILGLTTDLSKDIIMPKYDNHINAAQVFKEAMTYIVNRGTDPFDVLRTAGIGYEDNATFPDLPSWVPDWSQVSRVFMVDSDYSAGIAESTSIRIHRSNDSALELIVRCFDRLSSDQSWTKIFEMQSRWTEMDADLYQGEWYRAAEELAKTNVQAISRFDDAQSLYSAFVQTMTGNRRTYGRESPNSRQQEADYEDFQTFATIKQRVRAGIGADEVMTKTDRELFERLDASTRRFLHFSGQVLLGRRFCVTQRGRLAIIPPYCLENDVLCVVLGSRVPYVLREVENIGWRIVGSCYVHGSMHGEECRGMRQNIVVV